jgi:hypothetical protein
LVGNFRIAAQLADAVRRRFSHVVDLIWPHAVQNELILSRDV